MYLTVALLHPSEPFDVASILRFLYTFIGPSFKLLVITRRGLSLDSIRRYSRVPPSILRFVLRITNSIPERSRLVVMDYEGVDPKDVDINLRGAIIVIPWRDTNVCAYASSEILRVKPPISCGIVRYDAISLLYTLLRNLGVSAARSYRCNCVDWGPCDSGTVRKLVYLSKKLLESYVAIDSCIVYETHAVTSVISRVARESGLELELEEGMVIQGIDGCRQRVVMNAFKARNGSFVGRIAVSIDGGTLRVECDRFVAKIFPLCGTCMCLDPVASKAIICGEAFDTCVKGVDHGLVRFFGS